MTTQSSRRYSMETNTTLEMKALLQSTGNIFSQHDVEKLSQQISAHRYLINQSIPWVISDDDAAFSWQENVFQPINSVIQSWPVRNAFRDQSEAELFFAISDHWYYLLAEDSRVSAFTAAVDYAARYGKGLGKLISRFANPNRAA